MVQMSILLTRMLVTGCAIGAAALLAACTAPPDSEDTSLIAPVAEEVDEAENPTPSVPEASPTADEALLQGVDDRPEQLRALTADWQTDWTRHTVDYDEIIAGGPPRDGIPSLDQPAFVGQEEASAWLATTEPVIALELNGETRAYPVQILTWHEIVNDEVGGVPVAVTFCPLCNSAVVFDRRVGEQVYEFGVSGLLRNSDLIMYDRTTESLWQQFTGEGIVGQHAGDRLTIVPASLISFAEFRAAYPDAPVLSRETGYSRQYGVNPYVGYDSSTQPFLFRGPPDPRLPAMMRVVGVNLNGVQIAYPYDVLVERGVIHDVIAGQSVVVFHSFGTNSALGAAVIAEAEDVGATGVFAPIADGQALTFTLSDGRILDEQTGSMWNLAGQAVEGELAGACLERIAATDHFWFSWAAFYPDTVIFQNNASEEE